MSGEPDTTLAWAEFLWRVAREAPEVVLAYLLLLEFARGHRARPAGRHIVVELSDSVAVSDAVSAHRLTLGIAQEHDLALPIRAVGGAPS